MNPTMLALPPADQGPATPGGGDDGGGFNPMILLIGVMLLFVLMPLFNKKDRHRRKRVEELKKHDKVVTTGGLLGTIVALDDTTVTLEVSKDVRLRFKRTSIFDVDRPEAAEAAAPVKKDKKKAG